MTTLLVLQYKSSSVTHARPLPMQSELQGLWTLPTDYVTLRHLRNEPLRVGRDSPEREADMRHAPGPYLEHPMKVIPKTNCLLLQLGLGRMEVETRYSTVSQMTR